MIHLPGLQREQRINRGVAAVDVDATTGSRVPRDEVAQRVPVEHPARAELDVF